MKARHFASAAEFREWLEQNHATARELLVGFFKKASGKGGLTYPEAVDELLCFGWIDGIKRRVDDDAYTHRITPRREGSIWSKVNVAHVRRLTTAGRMHAAGLTAFARRTSSRTGIYSYEQAGTKAVNFSPQLLALLRKKSKAWKFWNSQPPGYRRQAIRWVMTAKQSSTQRRRMVQLIALSAKQRRILGK